MPQYAHVSYAPLPTASQSETTRELITAKKRQIVAAKAQIQQHEARAAALRCLVRQLDREVAFNEAYIAPVRRLPFEVLGHIVVLCATEPDAPVQVLRVLASICKTWRDATQRTPQAWTKIDIEMFSDRESKAAPPGKKLRSLRDVQEWYDRSCTCKKDVSLRAHDSAEVDSVVQLVISRSSELRTLDPLVFNTGRSARDLWDKLLSCSMPFLRGLAIYKANIGEDLTTTLAQSCPQLSCVDILGLSSCEGLVPLQTRLRRLDLPGSADFVLDTLRAGQGFVNLRWLSLNVFHASSPAPVSNDSRISLPKLRALFLRIDDVTIPYLQILHTPHLDILGISRRLPEYRGEHVTKKQMATLLRPAGDLPLLELRICDLHVSDADLLQLLERLPRLELLAVVGGKTSDKVMAALSSKQGKPAHWLCPNLARLCIMSDKSSKSDKFRVSRDGMDAFLSARLHANRTATPQVSRLMRVRLDDNDLVFDCISGVHWTWQGDRALYTNDISPASLSADLQRWWFHPSQWQGM